MPAQVETGYRLVQDEPWIFLDVRNNPVHGRKLSFLLDDGTVLEVDVTPAQYAIAEEVKRRLLAQIAAHNAIAGIAGR